MSKTTPVQIFNYKIVSYLVLKYLFGTYYVPDTSFHAVDKWKIR